MEATQYGGFYGTIPIIEQKKKVIEDKRKIRQAYAEPMDVPFPLPYVSKVAIGELLEQKGMVGIIGQRNIWGQIDHRMIHHSQFPDLVERFLESSKGQELLEKKIEEKLSSLSEVALVEKVSICDMSRDISDEIAETEIKNFIDKLKEDDIKQFNLLDVSLELNLPFEQIDRILEKLRKRD